MILRSVIKHVQDQNWFAVAIDFLIVVVGVFIGIQVSNWNAGLADQARGERIKARLVAEFIEIESELTRHVNDVTSWIEIANRLAEDVLADNIERDALESSDRLFSIRWRPTSGGSNTTAELISQGDMDALRSPDLVEALLRFDTLATRHTSNNLALRRLVSDDRNKLQMTSFLAAIPSETRPDDFSQRLSELASAPDLYLSIVNYSNALQIDLMWYAESLNRACAVLQELEASCGGDAAESPEMNSTSES